MVHQVTISWTASPGPIDGYNVYRGTVSGNETGPALNGGTPVIPTTYTDTTVFPGQIYSYTIRATRAGIESVDSIDVVTAPVPFPPSPAFLEMDGAASFGVLAGSTVTNTGTTRIAGDVGVSPGTSITGLGSPSFISGVFHSNDFVSQGAESSLASAIANAQALPGATTIPADIGGMTFAPGLYNVASSLAITGTVILDAGGDPNAVWIFRAGSTLTTAASNSSVMLTGGAQAINVFWVVGSSATLGVATSFAGNILAAVSITVNTGAAVNGRLLAHTGAVTLAGNAVVVFQACDLIPLPPSPPNVAPSPPTAPSNLVVTSES